jgi:hypothetical protein
LKICWTVTRASADQLRLKAIILAVLEAYQVVERRSRFGISLQ